MILPPARGHLARRIAAAEAASGRETLTQASRLRRASRARRKPRAKARRQRRKGHQQERGGGHGESGPTSLARLIIVIPLLAELRLDSARRFEGGRALHQQTEGDADQDDRQDAGEGGWIDADPRSVHS